MLSVVMGWVINSSILRSHFDTKVRNCRISKYQINYDILRFWDVDIFMILFWNYHMIVDISFVCYFTVIFWYYQINCEIRRFCDVDIIMIFWYYQMLVDISFVCHLTVIFWYYHDILIYQNIKLTVRFWWYYHDI